MKKLAKFLLIIICLVFTTQSCTKIAGKIFTREEANSLFGSTDSTAVIAPAELAAAIAKTDKNVMFRIFEGKAVVLGDRRTPIYPTTSFVVGETDVYHAYSKAKVLELLSKGKGDMVYLENRKNVFSVTFGEYTLEFSYPCPPWCE